MKKLLAISLILFFTQTVCAQSKDSTGRIFKKFKVDFSLGYASPQSTTTSNGTSAGVLVAIEPKYAVMDELSIGLRLEGAVTAKIAGSGSSAKANGSYLLTGDYYFMNKQFRPFAGVGAGVFTTASVDSSTNVKSIPTSTQFGFMARAGFEFGHLRIGVEYNFAGDKASYLGIKLGVCFGGGRKGK